MAIETNQIVSLEYELRDGSEVIDSNVGGEPLVFMVGKGQIIPGLESQLCAMNMGDKGDIHVKSIDAYGEYNDEAVQEVPKDQFAGIELTEGMSLYGQDENGGTVQVTVKTIGEENVMIDYNHALAGKDLMFSVTINEVRDATAEEAMTGIPAENAQPASSGESCGTGCGCH